MAEEQTRPFWNRRTFLLITGASRGIGKNLAIEFSRYLAPQSTILLMARALPKLEETKQEILKIAPSLNVDVSLTFYHVSQFFIHFNDTFAS